MTARGRPPWAPLAAVAALLALAGCSSWFPQPPMAERETPVPEQPRQQTVQPAPSREHQRILVAYGGSYDDPKLEAQVTQVVDRLVMASERPDLKYKVVVLNSPAINAFSLPNGQLYVTRGLLALANDTSELASVLSHEMAHVIANHAAIRENQARHAAIVSSVVTDVLSDPSSGALALAKSKIALASFSRAQEFEADGIGVGIAARAGYDPYGAVRFLTSMERNAELKPAGSSADLRSIDFMSSHPATPERIKNAQLNSRQFTAPGPGERDRAAYLASLDGTVYGEDPSEGYVRSRRFIHPRLGFTFTAPEGFALDNTAQAVLGVRDGGTQAMRLDVARVPVDQSLASYITSGWIENIDPQSVADISINGFPAVTATARGQDWTFRLYVIRFGSDTYRFIYAARALTAEADRSFRASVDTFRRLSLSEIEAARPMRLRILTVRAGETVETIANRQMAHVERPVERFRALNGLGPHDRLKVGEAVKTLAE